MLDEPSKRKPNFDQRNSMSVVLADGQSWWIPKPWLEIRPVFRDGQAVTAYPVLTYNEALDELVQAIAVVEDIWEQVTAIASVAAWLLRWHYELTDHDLDQLLAFRRGDDVSLAWMQYVCNIATGQSGPKVSSAWRRLTLLAQGTMPPMLLLEDSNDLANFLEATGRTVRRSTWADEAIAAKCVRQLEGIF